MKNENEKAISVLENVSKDISQIRDIMEILDRLFVGIDLEWDDNPKKCELEFTPATSLFDTVLKSVTLLEVLTVDSIHKLYASSTTNEQENRA